MKKKRTNPNQIPCTQADLKRSVRQARRDTIEAMHIVYFTVMREKFGFENHQLRDMWNEVDSLCRSIAEGKYDKNRKYCTIADLKNELKKDGINIEQDFSK